MVASGVLREVGAQMLVPHVHQMHEEEGLSTMPAAPFLAPSTLVCHFGSSHFSQTGCDGVSRPDEEVPFVFPLRRRVMPRRGWHNEEWSRQWLQLLMGPRPPSVQWPRSRPRQPPKGSGKGRGRSQSHHSEVPVPKPTVSTTRTSPAEKLHRSWPSWRQLTRRWIKPSTQCGQGLESTSRP